MTDEKDERRPSLPVADPLRLDRDDWDMVSGRVRVPIDREGEREG